MRREYEGDEVRKPPHAPLRAHHLRWAGGMITVAEHFDLPALDRLRDLWRDLWWKTPNASFVQSFEAFDRLCTHAAKGERARLFVVCVSGRPVGLAPWVEKTVRGRMGRLRILTDGDPNLGLSRGPLGPNPRLTLETVTQYVERDRRWDRIDLRRVETTNGEGGQDNRRVDPAESQGTLEDSRVLIECRGDWVRYLRALPTHIRERYQRLRTDSSRQRDGSSAFAIGRKGVPSRRRSRGTRICSAK